MKRDNEVLDHVMRALNEVSSGTVSAEEAGRTIRSLLGHADEVIVEHIYTVLRTWAWLAITERRRDDELRDWYTLVRSIAAELSRRKFEREAHFLQVIYELVDNSVAASESAEANTLFERAHVREVLVYLRDLKQGYGERVAIRNWLGVKDANLTRIMNLLIEAGLVERKRNGKSAFYYLTREGLKMASSPEMAVEAIACKDAIDVDLAYGETVKKPFIPIGGEYSFGSKTVDPIWTSKPDPLDEPSVKAAMTIVDIVKLEEPLSKRDFRKGAISNARDKEAFHR